MTDTVNDSTNEGIPAPPPGFRTPEQEGVEIGVDVPPADELSIGEINPYNAHLFAEDRWHRYFERLREEDPIHLNEMAVPGRYWSITKFNDIREIEKDWETFSSAKGITLGLKPGTENIPPEQQIQTFIAMDPPQHRDERRTVTPAVQPQNLENIDPLIRERTVEVLAGQTVTINFWVKKATTKSAEIMAWMLSAADLATTN